MTTTPFVLSVVEGRAACETLAHASASPDTNGKRSWAGNMMAFWTHMLRCADGRFHVGGTDGLERRMAEHRDGRGCDYPARRRPVTLAWTDTFVTRLEALTAERQLKGWTRAKEEALIRGDWATISHLARPPSERGTNVWRNDAGKERQ